VIRHANRRWLLNDDEIRAMFYSRIDASSVDGCWPWLCDPLQDYGRMSANGVRMTANRWSWILHKGPIPAGMNVLHSCDNRRCARPSHLFLGDAKANAADMIAKGRHWSQQAKAAA
jgi:hypothetical protein